MAAFTLVACATETTQSEAELQEKTVAQSAEAPAPRGERGDGNRPGRAGLTDAAEKLGVTQMP